MGIIPQTTLPAQSLKEEFRRKLWHWGSLRRSLPFAGCIKLAGKACPLGGLRNRGSV